MKSLLTVLILFISCRLFAEEKIPELEITNIDQGVYLHKSYQHIESYGLVSSNGLIVIDDKKAFLLDTPWSEDDTKKLATWVKSKGYVLAGSISTHSHEDRTAGIKYLNSQSVPTYASKLTNELLKKGGKEQASNTLDGTQSLLFNRNVEAFYPGGGHTIDNIVIWLPKSKILYGGCLIRSLNSKGLGYIGEADIKSWPRSAGKVITKYPNAKIVVPGHGGIGDVRLLTHTKKLAEAAIK